jgi:hypothetical protein
LNCEIDGEKKKIVKVPKVIQLKGDIEKKSQRRNKKTQTGVWAWRS